MSEAQSGSAILSGNPSGQGGAGGSMGAAAPGVPDGAQASAAPAANGSWYDQIQDADLKGYVQNKGWADPVELANGYRNLEKLLGGEKLPMPKGDTDVEGWSRVYDALGRPSSAADYKLPVPEGDPGTFAKAAADKFHELGISTKQANALAEWWNASVSSNMDQVKQQSAQQSQADLQALQREWGGAFDENAELGRRAAREFGLDEQKLTRIENAIGTKELLQLMSRIGRGLTEHDFESGKSTDSFGMTPEAAQQRIKALQQDADFVKKYQGKNADAMAEMSRLFALAYPDG